MDDLQAIGRGKNPEYFGSPLEHQVSVIFLVASANMFYPVIKW
jgi:hypothetical protein